MNPLEIIILIVFIAISVLLIFLAVSALQLIKELKTSLHKLNKILDRPENINTSFTHRLADTLTHSSSQLNPSSPHLFHRQKQS